MAKLNGKVFDEYFETYVDTHEGEDSGGIAEKLKLFVLCFENRTCPVGHKKVVIAVPAVQILYGSRAAEVADSVGGFYSALECMGWISQPECSPRSRGSRATLCTVLFGATFKPNNAGSALRRA